MYIIIEMREKERIKEGGSKRFSKYYSDMRFDVNQAQSLANILTMELDLPYVKVVYKGFLNGCNGIYKEYANEIEIQKDRNKLRTILHEIAHHVQYRKFGFFHGNCESVHGIAFQKALRKAVATFKTAYKDPNFIYVK